MSQLPAQANRLGEAMQTLGALEHLMKERPDELARVRQVQGNVAKQLKQVLDSVEGKIDELKVALQPQLADVALEQARAELPSNHESSQQRIERVVRQIQGENPHAFSRIGSRETKQFKLFALLASHLNNPVSFEDIAQELGIEDKKDVTSAVNALANYLKNGPRTSFSIEKTGPPHAATLCRATSDER